jgi:hypothetical protein
MRIKLDEGALEIRVDVEDEFIPINADQLPSYTEEQLEDLREAASQNIWKWCSVGVTAHYTTEDGTILVSDTEWLGCCSYESEQDFIDNSGYYEDMKDTVTKDIMGQVKNIYDYVVHMEAEAEDYGDLWSSLRAATKIIRTASNGKLQLIHGHRLDLTALADALDEVANRYLDFDEKEAEEEGWLEAPITDNPEEA